MTSTLLDTFDIKYKQNPPDRVHSLTSDGTFLYLQSTAGLYKVGSGYGGTIKGKIYVHNQEFYSKSGKSRTKC